jgi:hypothetical protein
MRRVYYSKRVINSYIYANYLLVIRLGIEMFRFKRSAFSTRLHEITGNESRKVETLSRGT